MEKKDNGKLKNILFVCTGNSCRSVIAEKYLQSLNVGVNILSCGISATNGASLPLLTKMVLENFGLSIPFHKIKQVTYDIVCWADIIFVMEEYQKKRLIELFPEAAGKIHLLGRHAGLEDPEILDPYGGSIEAYETCFMKIKDCIDKIKW